MEARQPAQLSRVAQERWESENGFLRLRGPTWPQLWTLFWLGCKIRLGEILRLDRMCLCLQKDYSPAGVWMFTADQALSSTSLKLCFHCKASFPIHMTIQLPFPAPEPYCFQDYNLIECFVISGGGSPFLSPFWWWRCEPGPIHVKALRNDLLFSKNILAVLQEMLQMG